LRARFPTQADADFPKSNPNFAFAEFLTMMSIPFASALQPSSLAQVQLDASNVEGLGVPI
jgi:hypothetical protein